MPRRRKPPVPKPPDEVAAEAEVEVRLDRRQKRLAALAALKAAVRAQRAKE